MIIVSMVYSIFYFTSSLITSWSNNICFDIGTKANWDLNTFVVGSRYFLDILSKKLSRENICLNATWQDCPLNWFVIRNGVVYGYHILMVYIFIYVDGVYPRYYTLPHMIPLTVIMWLLQRFNFLMLILSVISGFNSMITLSLVWT